MYFKKLELLGFKSFAEKTVLHFEPGITAVVGPNGCGKCLHYDSLVTLSDGKNVKIGDLVEDALRSADTAEKLDDGVMVLENHRDINILSLNLKTFKIEPKRIDAFIKMEAPEYLLKIKTRSGKTVTSTSYHPFFSIKDGQIINLEAKQLKTGVRIAVPRALNPIRTNSKLELFEILRRFKMEDHVYVPYSQELADFLTDIKSNYATSAEMSSTLRIKPLAVKSVFSTQAMNVTNFLTILDGSNIREIPAFVKSLKSRSSGEIALPREMNTAIAKFLGYLISEGRTTKENQVWFVNEDAAIVEDFISSAYAGFKVEAKAFNYDKSAKDVLIFSSALCEFLEKAFAFNISSLSKDKVIPDQIFHSGEKIIAEFLSALFEGDAYICAGGQDDSKKGMVYFEYSTASEALAQGVSSLLLRLGVRSLIREKIKCATNTQKKKKRKYYSVYVYGLENVKLLVNLLNFVGRKSKKLEQIKKLKLKTNLNLDLIPEVNQAFKTLVKLSGIKVKKFKKISPKLISYYENRCLPTRQGLLEALSIVAEHGQIVGLASSIFAYLKMLTNSDIYWDEIVKIDKIYSQKWVYDLSILNNHNFIAQDIIVHNSNIFDSMRWVLGEQSVKSLRGSKMEDVIFNGTESLPALGYAEVSLTFSNETKALPIEYNEVTITRRLYRSGESEYLINKTQVRLKDILELFMGTGIGAESYSLIEQGKIDLILSSRPEDRRLVFDEAAGISKYKSQKRETLRKLEDTEANLLRINDIITEVKRQINSLERQAAKARRYKEVFDKLKGLEISLAAFQLKQYKNELTSLNAQLNTLINQEAQGTQVIEQLNKEFITKEREIAQIEASSNLMRQELNNAENVIVRNGQQLTLNQERLAELIIRIEALKKQKEELTLKITQDEEKRSSFKANLDGIAKELEDKKSLEAKFNTGLEAIIKDLNLTQFNIKEAKLKVLEFAAQEAAQNNQIRNLTSQLHQTIARKKRLDIEKFRAEEELTSTEQKLESANKLLEDSIAKFNEQKKHTEALQASYEDNLHEKEKLQSNLSNLEAEKMALESQKEFLTNLKLRYENISESSNAAIFLDSLSDKQISGIIIRVKEVTAASLKDSESLANAKFKAVGVAKPISLDPQETIAKIESLARNIENLKGDFIHKLQLTEELAKKVEEANRVLREDEIEYNNHNTQRENIQQYYKKIKDESDIVLSEFKETDEQLAQLKEEEQALEQSLLKIKTVAQSNQQAIEHWLEDVALKNSQKENTLIACTQLKTEILGYEEKVANVKEAYQMYENAYFKDKTALDSSLQEELNSVSRINELQESTVNLNIEIEGAKRQKEGIVKQLEDILNSFSEAKNNIRDLQAKIDGYKKGLDANRSKVHELQMRIQELSFSQNNVLERMSQVYKTSPGELTLEDEAALEVNLQDLNQEINQLKEKLDSYGQVNLVAIEEFEELKQRYDFLITQAEDLTKSKESLHEAILKINRTTKKMFLETFEEVAKEFRNYFRLLFGGGDAQLFLVDEQDVLESGIEIICRPPGKKLQNVLLLSGGEKAMSAIALLFAIFKVKPSPFCVLDEIDAALDEANVDRFARMLVDFTSQSQFIVITHNKKTIANANIMYGITMEKAGISKIVSVKLAEHKNAASDKYAQTASPTAEDKKQPEVLESA